METDFVSEVDRKFFSNNLLTSEDWESTTMNLEDFLDSHSVIQTDDLVGDLPDDLMNTLNDDLFPDSCFHDNQAQELSDSSDSGISGVLMNYDSPSSPELQIKSEPLSPASSLSSENSDKPYSQTCYSYMDNEIKAELSHVQGQGQTQPPVTFTYVSQSTTDVKPSITSCPVTSLQAPVKINTILNSKVKIQPKPLENTQSKCSVSKTESGQPLVLTPDEFKQLTAQGVLQFQPPTQSSKVIATKQAQPISPLPVAMGTSPLLQVDTELKAIKRQQRMIKNRESASLSRKRKKEYLTQLEIQLQEYTTQNQKLKEENRNLRSQLSAVQTENAELKKVVSVSPSKKICLMALFVVMGLNIMSFSDYLLVDRLKPVKPLQDTFIHRGRQLMSVQEDMTDNSLGNFMPDWSPSKLRKFMEDNPDLGASNQTLYQLITCPTYFNKTESMRLADQLSGWMHRVELEKKKSKKPKKYLRKDRKRTNTLRAAVRGDIHAMSGRHRYRENQYQIQVFDGMNSGNFWHAVPRRNDTFYVLSFNTDYLLVPATAHNKTMRPRMSLMMPAVALNESMQPPPGNIGMMQIDCEVLNTQLINVHKSAIPRHRPQHNSSFYKSEEEYL